VGGDGKGCRPVVGPAGSGPLFLDGRACSRLNQSWRLRQASPAGQPPCRCRRTMTQPRGLLERVTSGQQKGSKRPKSSLRNRAQFSVRGPQSRMNRAIARQSSPVVVSAEQACHAGGRGFESRRSRCSPCAFSRSEPPNRRQALRGPIVAQTSAGRGSAGLPRCAARSRFAASSEPTVVPTDLILRLEAIDRARV
jgi:hypothetical protein